MNTTRLLLRRITSCGALALALGLVGPLHGAAPPARHADGRGSGAGFASPRGVVVDGVGNVFVADFGNHVIRKIDPTGNVTTIAGSPGAAGNVDGAGGAARFSFPRGVALDPAGNLFVADVGNARIRRVDPVGNVTTYFGADGVAPGLADVAIDVGGVLYFIDDTAVFKIPSGGLVSTLAGVVDTPGSVDDVGIAARFSAARGLAVDSAGVVRIADTENATIRSISPAGAVTTIAGRPLRTGSADAQGAGARFEAPLGVAVSATGVMVVADIVSHTIRRIDPTGAVSTLAGRPGVAGDVDGPGAIARFNQPAGVAFDTAGNVFVADSGNNVIRKIDPAGNVSTWAGPVLPVIVNPPQDAVVNAGATATFAVVAAGDPAPTLLWERSLDAGKTWAALSDGANVAGATTATLSIFNAGAAENGARFRCVASSVIGAPTSEAATLLVNGVTPVIRVPPASVAVTEGASATFSVEVSSAPAANLQWQMSVNQGASWTDLNDAPGLTGSRTATLTLSGALWDWRGRLCRVVAGNASGNATSAPARLDVLPVRPPYVFTTMAGVLPGSVDGAAGVAQFAGPTGVAVDGFGTVFVVDATTAVVRQITAAGAVTTVAGTSYQNSGVDGVAGAAGFTSPRGMARDLAGNLYVTDGSTVRRIDPAGVVTTWAGRRDETGTVDGLAGAARFGRLEGIAIDGGGNLYVADAAEATIRKIDATGRVTTLAGSPGQHSHFDALGSAARFDHPRGIAVDGSGNVFVGDTGNFAVRKIDGAGIVTTFAGGPDSFGAVDGQGAAAKFLAPADLVVDGAGTVFVADGHAIRRIDGAGNVALHTGSYSDFGSTDGVGAAARFHAPAGLALDASGRLLVADTKNYLLRAVTEAGEVSTFAGIRADDARSDGPRATARMGGPHGVAMDEADRLYFVDWANDAVRIVDAAGTITTLATNLGYPQAVDVDAAGRAYVVGSDYALRRIDAAGNVTVLATMVLPWGIAVDPAGTVYVADLATTSVLKIAGTSRSVLASGIGALGLDVDANGNVFVVDGVSILKIDPAGVVSTIAGGREDSGAGRDGPVAAATFGYLSDIAVDDRGNLFVAEPYAHRVRRIDTAGNVVTVGGQTGLAGALDGVGRVTRFDQPWSVTVDRRGNVFVGDLNNRVVRRGTPDVAVPPVVVAAPGDRAVTAGAAASLSVEAIGFSPLSFQWRRNGTTIAGAIAANLTLPIAQSFQAGAYDCVITDAAGSVVTSAAASLTVGAAAPGNLALVNLSTRGFVGVGSQVMIPGFVVTGSGAKRFLIRGVGPTLATDFGLDGTLPDPVVELFAGATLLFRNDNWPDAPNAAEIPAAQAAVSAFPLSSANEAVLLVDLPQGAYTAVVSGTSGATGVAIIEVYQLP